MKHPDELFAEILEALIEDRRQKFVETITELKQSLDAGGLMPNPESSLIQCYFYPEQGRGEWVDELVEGLDDLKGQIEGIIEGFIEEIEG